MQTEKQVAALFDFDGVVMDTETQYSVFWNEQGIKYLGEEDFGRKIKGQTLAQIYAKHFEGMNEVQQQIIKDLDDFERNMTYEYLPGVEDFISDLHANGVKIALVTSSNEMKMAHVYRVHPELKDIFDKILTAEYFTRSKPDPECFLLGMEMFGAEPQNSFVFEDSFHGLQAGRDSGAMVIGLATTNPREAIASKADYVIDDFAGMSYRKMMELKK